MNEDQKLKLQAYLDNELSPVNSREVTEWLERDQEAQTLYAELADIRSAVRGNELDLKVPESREFYWSKIERTIRSTETETAARPVFRHGWWLRILAPAAGLAMLLVAALALLKLTPTPASLSYLHEIETPLEDTSAITFHSDAAGMTVVWVQTGEH